LITAMNTVKQGSGSTHLTLSWEPSNQGRQISRVATLGNLRESSICRDWYRQF